MIIYLNEKPYTVEEGITLAAFMQSIGVKPQGVAIAIAYEVIQQKKWDDTVLTDKMELMLIHAVSGG